MMRSKNYSKLFVVILVAVVFQQSVLNQIVVMNAHPDVLVLLAVCAGVVLGPAQGAIVAFCLGIGADLLVDMPFGLSCLAFSIAAFTASYFQKIPMHKSGVGNTGLLCVSAALITTLLYAIIATLVGQHGMLTIQLLRVLVVIGIGGIVMVWPSIHILKWAIGNDSLRHSQIPPGGSAA